MNILFIITSAFIAGSLTTLLFIDKKVIENIRKPKNKVHFYVARNKSGMLNLFLNKPSRDNTFMHWRQYDFYALGNGHHKWLSTRIVEDDYFKDLGLNPDDFKHLKWEDEPIEVFLNLED